MKTLDDLYKLINKENIVLDENWNVGNDLSGIYLMLPGCPPIIAINKSIKDRKKLCSILSEELGHYYTTSGDLTQQENNNKKVQAVKMETRAKKWAANFLISDDELVQALINCISTKWDICEYFNATDELLKYKLYSILENEDKYNDIRNKLKKHEVAYSVCEI